jgi:primosomal protein N' (replication factor Y) (superfamily II helicase)
MGSDTSSKDSEQLSLAGAAVAPPRERSSGPAAASPTLPRDGSLAAEVDPVALVLVDVGLPHLDRPFEYLVPAAMADLGVPGARVKVRFAGQDVGGYILARAATADHDGTLAPLRKVVSGEAVLTAQVLALSRAIASRYAGTLGDVVRLAVPPRHATAEKNLAKEAPTSVQAQAQAAARSLLQASETSPWRLYPAGASFLRHLSAGDAPAGSWLALPGQHADADWPAALAVAAATALAQGRGSLIVVPDHRDVDRVDAALVGLLGAGQHVRLTAGQGPQARYTAWLKVLRGHVRCVVGTRAAMFAPVHDLALVAWWDDGDDLLVEQRAPYPHVREVLRARARLEGAALLTGGFTRTTSVQAWVESGQVRSVCAGDATRRLAAPRVVIAGEGADLERDGAAARAHLPSAAWRAAKDGLGRGPVLIQVPRRGYLPSLSCMACREPARCARCHGPLALNSPHAPATCRWCGKAAADFQCTHCGSRRVRSTVVGARRTAEELGRAFPGVTVHTSGGGEVLASVSGKASLVIATPGAEPITENGYAATLLLDAWASLDRPTLDASEEALRRWLAAAALTRGAGQGGVTVLCGAPMHTTLPLVEALVRWDPAWFAARELAERVELSLPPAVRMAQLVGTRVAVQSAVEMADLADSIERLGPLPWAPVASSGAASDAATMSAARGVTKIQLLLRAGLEDGPALTAALTRMKALRSARKEPEAVAVRVDPMDGLG